VDYRQAGVNIEEGYRAVGKYREYAARTMNSAVLNGLGSFAGMFSLGEFRDMKEPVLVSGTDGVGTKLEIAFAMKKYDTVGIDCVAMCVNDILCHGAKPLFFLDYLACGKLDAGAAAELVKGVAAGCGETGSVLLGGETAEMPGFYSDGKYDLAGFAAGIADREKIIDGSRIREGDALVGVSSSGVHSNGFSLIRKTLPDLNEDFGGMPLGMALLEPTRLYVKPVLELMQRIEIKGMAHITGGGFYENIPRMFAPGGPLFDAVIRKPAYTDREKGAWLVPPIFARIASGCAESGASGGKAEAAGIDALKNDPALEKMMFNTYNMGIGFVIAVDPGNSRKAAEYLEGRGFPAREIGRVEKARGNAGELRFE
jgi:phosphoribosylformylglycinamidine cyclo-ligase